jgi:hypothetical protein
MQFANTGHRGRWIDTAVRAQAQTRPPCTSQVVLDSVDAIESQTELLNVVDRDATVARHLSSRSHRLEDLEGCWEIGKRPGQETTAAMRPQQVHVCHAEVCGERDHGRRISQVVSKQRHRDRRSQPGPNGGSYAFDDPREAARSSNRIVRFG